MLKKLHQLQDYKRKVEFNIKLNGNLDATEFTQTYLREIY
jgi:hypothetical protein